MSDVEKFYESARKHFPNSVPWSQLNPAAQQQLIMGINLILGVMN
jgi:hypothetical protein